VYYQKHFLLKNKSAKFTIIDKEKIIRTANENYLQHLSITLDKYGKYALKLSKWKIRIKVPPFSEINLLSTIPAMFLDIPRPTLQHNYEQNDQTQFWLIHFSLKHTIPDI